MAQPSFQEILSAIKGGKKLAPVYILMGEEAYFIDTLVDAFENYVIPEEDRDFNQNIFYGNDADIEAVVACARQFPVMADRKLVLLKEAQTMNQAKNQLEKIAPYVKQPSTNTVFVVAYKGESLNATSKVLKAASASGSVVFNSAIVREYQLPAQVRDFCNSRKVNMNDKAISLLCEYIGLPLSKIFGEITKLIQIKGNDKSITCEDIEKNIGISKDYNIFELLKAVASKNYPQAMKIVKYFSQNPKPNPTVMATSNLFNLFSRICICHYTSDKSDKSLLEATGLKSTYQLKEVKEGARNYNPAQAVKAVHAIREFDAKSKGVGSYQNEYDLLQELIFKIFTS